MGVERVNFPQDAVSRKEANVEGEVGVAHPKRHLLGSVENEKHTLVLGHRLSKHEPFGLSCLIDGQFDRHPGVPEIDDGKHIFLNLTLA